MAVEPRIEPAIWQEVSRAMVAKRWAKPGAKAKSARQAFRQRLSMARMEGQAALVTLARF